MSWGYIAVMLNGILIGAAIPVGVEVISTGVALLVGLLQLITTRIQAINRYRVFKSLNLVIKITKQNKFFSEFFKF